MDKVKIVNGRFGTVQTKQKVNLKDFKTITYISGPIPDREFSELLDLWKRERLPSRNDSKTDIFDDDAYYRGNNGCNTNCPEDNIWEKRDDRRSQNVSVICVKETCLQGNWQEKKKRPLPQTPEANCSSHFSEDDYDMINDGDIAFGKKMGEQANHPLIKSTEFIYYFGHRTNHYQSTNELYTHDDTLLQDSIEKLQIYTEEFDGYLIERPFSQIRERAPLQIPENRNSSENYYDETYEAGLQHKTGIRQHLITNPCDISRARPISCNDHFYVQEKHENTNRSEENSKVSRPTKIVKLAMPTITWATQTPSTGDGTRCSSTASDFISIGYYDNGKKGTNRNSLDSSLTSTSSSFIRVEIDPNMPEINEMHDRPPPIPERPNRMKTSCFKDSDIISESTKIKEFWCDSNVDETPPPIPPRVPISNSCEIDGLLLMITADQDESKDKREIAKHARKHEDFFQHHSSEYETDVEIYEEPSIPKKDESELTNNLTNISVESSDKQTTNEKQLIQDQPPNIKRVWNIISSAQKIIHSCEVNENQSSGQFEESNTCINRSERRIDGDPNGINESNRASLTKTRSDGIHEDIHRLRTKRQAISERNIVDKELIKEQKVINDELKVSVKNKKELAVLQREEIALESALQSIQTTGMAEDFKEDLGKLDEIGELGDSDSDIRYFSQAGWRSSFRRGFRRSRRGSMLSRRMRSSISSVDLYYPDSGIGNY